MFDPLTTLSGLLGMFLDILGTTLTAFFLPTVSLILFPLLNLLLLFS